MRRFLTTFLVLISVVAARGLAADVSGNWAMNIVDKDATHRHATCTFVQEGRRLTGTCGPENVEGSSVRGEINGNELAWQVEGGPAYKAVLDETLTFMKGTFSGAGEGLFTAMKTR
ncbi:MAG: hypothetical protein ND807_06135 [Vicinamibacterales bacterium]|nr:hypothetical protein [Vicinamibacterales bacterium]